MSHTIRCFQDLLPEQGVFYPLSNDISKFCDSKIVFQVLYVDLSLLIFGNGLVVKSTLLVKRYQITHF